MNFLDLRSLRKRLPKNNQKGFTLIELLVVISILGILAAVVTMSLVGITKVAQTRAGDTETKTVQVAMDTMLADMGVDASAACTGAPTTAGTSTSDMTKFFPHQRSNGLRRRPMPRSRSTHTTCARTQPTAPTTARTWARSSRPPTTRNVSPFSNQGAGGASLRPFCMLERYNRDK